MRVKVSLDMAFLRAQFDVSVKRETMWLKLGGKDLLTMATEKRQKWLFLCDYASEHGVLGIILRNAETTQWCALTPDPAPGCYRYTCFDSKGFFAHGEYARIEEALIEAFRMGYRYVDSPDTLARISASSDWIAYS